MQTITPPNNPITLSEFWEKYLVFYLPNESKFKPMELTNEEKISLDSNAGNQRYQLVIFRKRGPGATIDVGTLKGLAKEKGYTLITKEKN